MPGKFCDYSNTDAFNADIEKGVLWHSNKDFI